MPANRRVARDQRLGAALVLARSRRVDRHAGGSARATNARSTARSLRTRGRGVPRPGAQRFSRDGGRRSAALGDRRRRRQHGGRRQQHPPCRCRPVAVVSESVWAHVVGQPQAVSQLTFAAGDPVHAYLFVGPPGSTKAEASRSFAALLMAGHDDPTDRDARLALVGQHPDVREIERTGARISAEQVADIIRNASLAPVEGRRKVMILHDFHLLDAPAAARLLKTVEEPPPGTIFIVLADQVTPELVTIASRCVRITFAALSDEVVAADLVEAGVDPEMAAVAAIAAGGDLTRARVLASDPGLMERRDAFAGAAHRLDGTGNTVVSLCTELLALIDAAAAPLAARQAEELTALESRVAATGERGSGRKQVEDHHKRELRRHRADELRSGLAVLAGTYRDALVQGQLPRPEAGATAVTRIHSALEAMERNPNELLLLQSLLLELPSL